MAATELQRLNGVRTKVVDSSDGALTGQNISKIYVAADTVFSVLGETYGGTANTDHSLNHINAGNNVGTRKITAGVILVPWFNLFQTLTVTSGQVVIDCIVTR